MGATTSTCRRTRFRAALPPTISSKSCLTSSSSSSMLSSRSRSRRSCTKVIHRNGESFNTAVATRTGTRVPSFRISSFSNGVQAPNRRPSSCANSSSGAYSGGVRSGQCSRPASKSSRLYPTSSRNASFTSGIRSNSPETMPAMVDCDGIGRMRARLRRSFSSRS